MAPPSTPQRRPFSLLRCIGISILTLIIVAGLIILIIWLAIRPRHPVYVVENATVHNFNLTADNHLTANFNFTLKLYNPNKKISIYYESLEVRLNFGNEQVAFTNWVTPFHQSRRNVTYLSLFLPAKDVALQGNDARDFKNERSAGNVGLVIKVDAKARFKMGAWKSHYRIVRVICTPTESYSSKGFKEAKCNVDL